MAFIAENELEQALVRAVNNRAAGPEFYRLLLESDLLVLGTVEGQEEAADQFTLEPGDQLKLVTGRKDGNPFLPVFSSLTRMQAYLQQESKYLRVNGRALLDVTRGAPVTLNPGSDYGKELTAEQVRQLLEGPRIIAGEAEPPAQLTQALLDFFSTRPDIETGWLMQVTTADRATEPHPLVGIETSGDWPSLMQALRAEAGAAVPGMVFDVQRVDRRNPAGLVSALLQAEPFYQRRAAGLN